MGAREKERERRRRTLFRYFYLIYVFWLTFKNLAKRFKFLCHIFSVFFLHSIPSSFASSSSSSSLLSSRSSIMITKSVEKSPKRKTRISGQSWRCSNGGKWSLKFPFWASLSLARSTHSLKNVCTKERVDIVTIFTHVVGAPFFHSVFGKFAISLFSLIHACTHTLIRHSGRFIHGHECWKDFRFQLRFSRNVCSEPSALNSPLRSGTERIESKEDWNLLNWRNSISLKSFFCNLHMEPFLSLSLARSLAQ